MAAAAGRISYAGWLAGGRGYEVTIDHGNGLRSIYAHLSAVEAQVGHRVTAGSEIGRIGASGDATGPHPHFELRLRGAAIDPALTPRMRLSSACRRSLGLPVSDEHFVGAFGVFDDRSFLVA